MGLGSIVMWAHGSTSVWSEAASWSLLPGASESDLSSSVAEAPSLARAAREAAGRGLAPARARTAAALTRVATAGVGPGGGVVDRTRLRERLRGLPSVCWSATGKRCWEWRDDALGLEPPGFVGGTNWWCGAALW